MNYTTIIVALITSLPPTIVAYLAWRESRRTHLTVNSRMTELLEASKGESRAKGKEEGKVEERKEVSQREKEKTK